jgi:hypothetical protein
VSIIDRETGAPFMIVERINNPYVEFVVRPSIYSREEDYVFKTYINMFDKHKFQTTDIVDYNGSVWDNDNPPATGDEYKLHRRTVSGISDYAYYDYTNNEWIEYTFRISFQFPYNSTSAMESKTYKYEVTLFGGNINASATGDQIPLIVDYKHPLLEASDFVVGGSLSE